MDRRDALKALFAWLVWLFTGAWWKAAPKKHTEPIVKVQQSILRTIGDNNEVKWAEPTTPGNLLMAVVQSDSPVMPEGGWTEHASHYDPNTQEHTAIYYLANAPSRSMETFRFERPGENTVRLCEYSGIGSLGA